MITMNTLKVTDTISTKKRLVSQPSTRLIIRHTMAKHGCVSKDRLPALARRSCQGYGGGGRLGQFWWLSYAPLSRSVS